VIRPATTGDLPLVRELWQAFDSEIPDAPWRDDDSDDDLAELERAIADKDVVLLAEEDGVPVGLAVAAKKGARLGFLHILYVRPEARQRGVASELVRETAVQLREQGAAGSSSGSPRPIPRRASIPTRSCSAARSPASTSTSP
jgi:ribosomal protein S18 acetylase RimI-like enzyme